MSDVLIRTEGGLGRITLNRPAALNALTLGMIEAVTAALAAWQRDDAIDFVLIDGAGDRGLCAGGDIRMVRESAQAGNNGREKFFRAEYRMNAQIAEYSKPIVALMDGIVMGGGIGISAHASHRIVTERSRLAMPETGIGFFPDIGATFLLSRPEIGELGTHIALAAAQLSADDARTVWLADYFIASEHLSGIPELLHACENSREIEAALAALATRPPAGKLHAARGWIDACYVGDDVEAILSRLDGRPEEAAHAAARDIRAKSPISLKQTLRMLRHARLLPDLRSCLEREFLTAVQITGLPDFAEGVRAAVIDKDRNPRWSIRDLAEVTPALLDQLFPSAVSGWTPLFDGLPYA